MRRKEIMTDRLIEQLKRHEGFRATPYRDSVGVWTVGYGFTRLTREESEVVLRMKVARLAELLAGRLQGVSLARQQVLLNMAYNLGIDGLLDFRRMWAAIENRNYDQAAAEMLNSTWARQVGPRADELVRMMRRG